MSHGSKAVPRSPYRAAALVVTASHQERAFCPWCKHARGIDMECWESSRRSPHGGKPQRENTNTDGRCETYAPSVLTRLVRVAGLRSPILIEAKP